jgi:hypothetical protein
MKKRQVKKFAKNSKRDLSPYRQARKGGNKKLRRRLKAFNRVHRAYDREQVRRLASCRELLEQIDACEPRNEKERLGIIGARAKVAASIERREEELRKKEELREERRSASKSWAALRKLMAGAIDENGCWRRTRVG